MPDTVSAQALALSALSLSLLLWWWRVVESLVGKWGGLYLARLEVGSSAPPTAPLRGGSSGLKPSCFIFT